VAKVEVNSRMIKDDPISIGGGSIIMITPPINESYWMYRVPLKHGQAIVAFPKFGTIGCGFAKEKDWNTNLPLDCPAEQIYSHIKHNKRFKDISDRECIDAIEALKSFVGSRGTKTKDSDRR
jgi:hypothetical protein